MIQKFNTEAEYAAAPKPTTESAVSRVLATNAIYEDGVMVETDMPEQGDICVIDAAGKERYFTLDSYNGSLLSANWTPVGFVEWRRGSIVKVDRVLGNYKWAQYFPWKVTNYVLDGSEHAFSFSVTVSGTAYMCEGNYSGETIEEVAASMNAIVKVFNFGGHSYHVYVRAGELILQHDTYTTYLAVTATGVTVTQRVGTEITASSAMPRRNGAKSGEGAVINLDRALIYFRQDLSSTTYNPNSDVTSIARGYPVCLPAYLGTSQYQSDHCALLRSHYGPGEAGWIKFMENQFAAYLSRQGIFETHIYGEGHENTYKLAGQKVEDASGNEAAFYPAFDAVAAVGFDCDGMRAGDWYLPTIGEIVELKKGIKYPAIYKEGVGSVSTVAAEADRISRACAKLNMSQVQNSSNAWSSSRYGANGAWYFNGSNGCAYYSYFCNAFQVVAAALLKLRAAQD